MNFFEKLEQEIKDASGFNEFKYYKLLELLTNLKKDYAKHKAEIYDEVCKELTGTIEIANKKRKQLLPL